MTQNLQTFVYGFSGAGPVTLKISEDDVTFYDMTITTILDLDAALSEWAQQANDHSTLALTYTFSISATGTVTLASSGTSYYKGPNNLYRLLGYADEVIGNGTSVSSVRPVLGELHPEGIGYELLTHRGELKAMNYRLGRSLALAHSHAQVVRWWATMTKADYDLYAAGPLFRGKVRIAHGSSASAYSISNLQGYLDVFPAGAPKITPIPKSDTYITVTWTGTLSEAADPAVPTAGSLEELARGWSYGWGVLYAAKVEGCGSASASYIFVEKDLGATDPSGYTQVAGLVIDRSAAIGAVINRREGLGAGFDLTLSLLDSGATSDGSGPTRQSAADAALVRNIFKTPSAATRLLANVTAAETSTVTVEATADFPTPGRFHIGRESISYTGKTTSPDTFTTLVRGMPAGDWRAYDHRLGSTVATYVTDTIQVWPGREVELYAVPVDPFGDVPGADLLADAVIIWRGHVSGHPKRKAAAWQMPCKPYDRRLTEPLGAGVSGKAVWGWDVDYLVDVDPTIAVVVQIGTIDATDGAETVSMVFEPFASHSEGDQLKASKWREEFATAATTAAAGLSWSTISAPPVFNDWLWLDHQAASPAFIGFTAMVTPGTNGQQIYILAWDVAAGLLGTPTGVPAGVTYTVDGPAALTDLAATTDTYPVATSVRWVVANGARFTLRMAPEDGDTGNIPATGFVIIEGNDHLEVHEYTSATIDDSGTGTALVEIVLSEDSEPFITAFGDDEDAEVSVRLAYKDSGTVPDVLRRMLASSGRTGGAKNDATYDSGVLAQGYDLEHISHTSIGDLLANRYRTVSMDLLIELETGYSQVFGGLLAMASRALVTRWDTATGDLLVTCVSTGLPVSGYFTAHITDTDLVQASAGTAAVKTLDNAHPIPNAIRLNINRIEDDTSFPLAFNDVQSMRMHGAEQWQISAYGVSASMMQHVLIGWSTTMLGLGLARSQLAEINVHPGIEARIGDMVKLTLSHPDLWTYSTGKPGYTGPARVLGSRINLQTGIKRLTLMLDGAHSTMSLCPAEQIKVIAAGSPPANIEIRKEAHDQFKQWFDEGGAFDVNAYLPGSETDTLRWTISAVDNTGSGGDTKLTISAQTGVFTPLTTWFVTVPKTATATDPQDEHAHTDTPGGWL